MKKTRGQNPLVKGLHDPKYRHNNIDGTVTLVPELLELYHRVLDVPLGTCTHHALHDDGVRLVAHFEDIVARDEAKPRPCRLKVIDCLSHVAFRGKYKGRETIVVVFDLNTERQGSRGTRECCCTLTFSSAQISNNR